MRRVVLAASLGHLVAGCLYVPYHVGPSPGSRQRPGDAAMDLLQKTPTREEVLLSFGEPDWVGKEQRLFVYGWRYDLGYMFYGWGYGGGGGQMRGARTYLLVEFGEDGLVRRSEVKYTVVQDVDDLIASW